MKLGVPKRAVLSMFDSYELSELMAYEKHAGPLDDSWSMEVQAQTHELLQQILIVLVDANSKKPSKMKVRPVPRPYLTPEDKVEDKKKPDAAQLNALFDLREQVEQGDGDYGAKYM